MGIYPPVAQTPSFIVLRALTACSASSCHKAPIDDLFGDASECVAQLGLEWHQVIVVPRREENARRLRLVGER